jgi:hypothetical protein
MSSRYRAPPRGRLQAARVGPTARSVVSRGTSIHCLDWRPVRAQRQLRCIRCAGSRRRRGRVVATDAAARPKTVWHRRR